MWVHEVYGVCLQEFHKDHNHTIEDDDSNQSRDRQKHLGYSDYGHAGHDHDDSAVRSDHGHQGLDMDDQSENCTEDATKGSGLIVVLLRFSSSLPHGALSTLLNFGPHMNSNTIQRTVA